MLYHKFKDCNLSALGFGLMRLPIVNEDNSQIDREKTAFMIDYAMKAGINYYDTAYGYHGGNSEPVIGEILSHYPRKDFYLASKFPGYDQKNHERIAEVFNEQLERCQVDYFDFYLLHTVSDSNIEYYLDPRYGLLDFMREQKAAGKIRHLGFSTHASLENMRRFYQQYHEDMEFCQIQFNWFDYSYQDAKSKLEMANEYGIPSWVMEPLRGGKLLQLAEDAAERLKTLRPEESLAAWSFRFLQSFPKVKMVLSGMSTLDQLKENIAIFSEDKPLNTKEMQTLLDLGQDLIKAKTIPCTNCKYCVPECPKLLNIPYILETYNQLALEGGNWQEPRAFEDMEAHQYPSACISCHRCEKQCPQSIKIAQCMADFSQRMQKQ